LGGSFKDIRLIARPWSKLLPYLAQQFRMKTITKPGAAKPAAGKYIIATSLCVRPLA
jgi:hypothetical protein